MSRPILGVGFTSDDSDDFIERYTSIICAASLGNLLVILKWSIRTQEVRFGVLIVWVISWRVEMVVEENDRVITTIFVRCELYKDLHKRGTEAND